MRDQLLEQDAINPEDTFEAKRTREEAARPPITEKALPPLFEPLPKGKIIDSNSKNQKPKQS